MFLLMLADRNIKLTLITVANTSFHGPSSLHCRSKLRPGETHSASRCVILILVNSHSPPHSAIIADVFDVKLTHVCLHNFYVDCRFPIMSCYWWCDVPYYCVLCVFLFIDNVLQGIPINRWFSRNRVILCCRLMNRLILCRRSEEQSSASRGWPAFWVRRTSPTVELNLFSPWASLKAFRMPVASV